MGARQAWARSGTRARRCGRPRSSTSPTCAERIFGQKWSRRSKLPHGSLTYVMVCCCVCLIFQTMAVFVATVRIAAGSLFVYLCLCVCV
jgi:hypothetical protein